MAAREAEQRQLKAELQYLEAQFTVPVAIVSLECANAERPWREHSEAAW